MQSPWIQQTGDAHSFTAARNSSKTPQPLQGSTTCDSLSNFDFRSPPTYDLLPDPIDEKLWNPFGTQFGPEGDCHIMHWLTRSSSNTSTSTSSTEAASDGSFMYSNYIAQLLQNNVDRMDEDPGVSPTETGGQFWDATDYSGSSFDVSSIESPASPMALLDTHSKRPLGETVERPESKRCRYTASK